VYAQVTDAGAARAAFTHRLRGEPLVRVLPTASWRPCATWSNTPAAALSLTPAGDNLLIVVSVDRQPAEGRGLAGRAELQPMWESARKQPG